MKKRGAVWVAMFGAGLGGSLLGGAPPATAQTSASSAILPDGPGTPTTAAAVTPPATLPAATGTTTLPGLHAVLPTPTPSSHAAARTPAPNILDMPTKSTSPTVPAPRVLGANPQEETGAKKEAPVGTSGMPFGSPEAKQSPAKPAVTAPAVIEPPAGELRTAGGLPTALDPTLTVGLPGAVPAGVPDFFIDNFDVPPFLLPIFQAAGAAYDVPWQVLAAINQIETNYGRDLSVSSAGAEGWMQFLPGTWAEYGVDATGDGVEDPYNPADAIFAAARYLDAAGAAKNLRGAIFAYNHASWYVDSVMLRAQLLGGMPSDLVSSITGLTDGVFPVHGSVTYADNVAEAAAAAPKSAVAPEIATTPTSVSATTTGTAPGASASVEAPTSTAVTPAPTKAGTTAATAPEPGELSAGATELATKATATPTAADAKRAAIEIYAKAGSPVVAVNDGVITAIGDSPTLGRYIELRDTSGNTYVYSQLKKVAATVTAPITSIPTAAPAGSANAIQQVDRALSLPAAPAPKSPASAGHQTAVATPAASSTAVPATAASTAPTAAASKAAAPTAAASAAAAPAAAASTASAHAPVASTASGTAVPTTASPTGAAQSAGPVATDTPVGLFRLFAHPNRPASFAAGGAAQLASEVPAPAATTHPAAANSLRKGAHVLAGTVLGWIGVTSPKVAPRLGFSVRPAGVGAPYIDPKPLLDGWQLLRSTAGAGSEARSASGTYAAAENPMIGEVLIETKAQLEQQVLADKSIQIYPLGRSEIAAGLVDQRVLAALEFLSESGLKPTVAAIEAPHTKAPAGPVAPAVLSVGSPATEVEISAINGIPVLDHQGTGSITDIAIRYLLTLPTSFEPAEIVSQMSYRSIATTVAVPEHADRISLVFSPLVESRSVFGALSNSALTAPQWQDLITQFGQIANPTVISKPSSAAIPDPPAAPASSSTRSAPAARTTGATRRSG